MSLRTFAILTLGGLVAMVASESRHDIWMAIFGLALFILPSTAVIIESEHR